MNSSFSFKQRTSFERILARVRNAKGFCISFVILYAGQSLQFKKLIYLLPCLGA